MSTFLALEIADKQVRYLFIEKTKEKMAVRRAGESTFAVDSSAPGALTHLIHEMIAEAGLAVSRIFLTINRQETVIHQLTLARMDRADLEVIVPAEIEKIPQFAEGNFDYLYKEYEVENSNKAKVIFAAMAEEFLQYVLREVKQTHIPCQELEIAPLNVTGLLGTATFKDGTQSLIVLVDHTTYLIVFIDAQIKYFYTTNTGMDTLFPAHLKGQADGPASLAWAEELKRVLKSYSLDNKQNIEKTWLLWDAQAAPSFTEYLHKEFNFDAQPLNILNHWFGEELNPIYLLTAVPAIYSLNKIQAAYHLDHFFRSTQVQSNVQRLLARSAVCVAAVSLILLIVIAHFSGLQQASAVHLTEVNRQIGLLEKKVPETLKLNREYADARDQLLFQATYVKLLNRRSWSEVFSVVAAELPEELSLTSFKVDESGLVTFTGEAFRMESIASLLRKVESSAILENGKFNYLSEQQIENKKVFSFEILASIKQGSES